MKRASAFKAFLRRTTILPALVAAGIVASGPTREQRIARYRETLKGIPGADPAKITVVAAMLADGVISEVDIPKMIFGRDHARTASATPEHVDTSFVVTRAN